MFKELKETTSKRLSMTMVSHQVETTNKETGYKKELNKNSKLKTIVTEMTNSLEILNSIFEQSRTNWRT